MVIIGIINDLRIESVNNQGVTIMIDYLSVYDNKPIYYVDPSILTPRNHLV